MKYGIIVNGRVTEPVKIPDQLPSWAADDADFLEKMFPGKTGWVVVPDDAVPGTLANGDGTYTTPVPPPPPRPEFKTLTGSELIALLASVLTFARVDQLLGKSKTIETLLLKAEKVDRLTGNTPTAIAYLKNGSNPLTDAELALIDAAWKALS